MGNMSSLRHAQQRQINSYTCSVVHVSVDVMEISLNFCMSLLIKGPSMHAANTKVQFHWWTRLLRARISPFFQSVGIGIHGVRLRMSLLCKRLYERCMWSLDVRLLVSGDILFTPHFNDKMLSDSDLGTTWMYAHNSASGFCNNNKKFSCINSNQPFI